MKKVKKTTADIEPILMPIKKVKRMMSNWQKCLPIALGDLFTRETKNGIERYDSYQLASQNVTFIKKLNNLYKGDNVSAISVIMGKKDHKIKVFPGSFDSSQSEFIPILKVELKLAHNNNLAYYFPTTPQSSTFNLNSSIAMRSKINRLANPGDEEQRLSPKVAELFIVNWQALGDTELISAFDCLSPEGTLEVNKNGPAPLQTVFSQQKLMRVKQYNYDEVETRAIFDNLNVSKNVDFLISLGAGLSVADYHPFNFRPIVRINAIGTIKKKTKTKTKLRGGRFVDELPPGFYDTSRPCPPWCKPDQLESLGS